MLSSSRTIRSRFDGPLEEGAAEVEEEACLFNDDGRGGSVRSSDSDALSRGGNPGADFCSIVYLLRLAELAIFVRAK